MEVELEVPLESCCLEGTKFVDYARESIWGLIKTCE